MPILFERDLADSYFYGSIIPWPRSPFAPRVAHADYTFLTKHLWRSEPPLRFIKPNFFAVPGLGRLPNVERPMILFGDFFLELEEHFTAFLEEFEAVLAKLHWRTVVAHLRGSRTGTFDFSWTAQSALDARSFHDPPPSSSWDFSGPRQFDDIRSPLAALKRPRT